jgi:hypothetical protein
LDGGGIVAGIAAENHWDSVSVQALYAYETPQEDHAPAPRPVGVHRWGLSVKADLILGLVADALYTWNPDTSTGIDGLSAGAGFDYSFAGGNCYVLSEYLYNGADSSTAAGLFALRQQHYLYALFRYRFNDFTTATLSCAAALEDLSFTPTLSADYEIMQGLALNVSIQVPIDKTISTTGEAGELGPKNSATKFLFTTLIRLRF